jgi:GT2 family glycosyltransferase
VSVCVPTFRRPDQLSRTLAAHGRLQPPEGGYEVVVVDDGSPEADPTRAAVERAAAQGLPVRLLRLEVNAGPGAARDAGWKESTGTWVAFTDDDCMPTPSWLVELLGAAREQAADVVQGRTLPDPDHEHMLSLPFSRSVRVESFSDYFETCNIAYRRELIERLGGFDPGFRLIADDTDLGWRAREAGAVVAFAPDAVVHHEVALRDWKADIRSRRRWADVVRMVRLHPDARRLAWRPYVYRPAHVVPLALAAALPILLSRRGRRLWLGLLGAIVLRDLVRAPNLEEGRAHLLQRVGDAYEAALLLRASVQQRTLLL